MANALADLYGQPEYQQGASSGGRIIGPSPGDIQQKLMPLMQGPTQSDIQRVPTPESMKRQMLAEALLRQRLHGKAKYSVEVGEPRQYAVEVGEPRIEPSRQAGIAESNDAHIRAAIAAKLTRAPVMGHVTDSNLVPMAQLAQVGVNADPNAEGIPYGLDPNQLNGLERGWLQKRTR